MVLLFLCEVERTSYRSSCPVVNIASRFHMSVLDLERPDMDLSAIAALLLELAVARIKPLHI